MHLYHFLINDFFSSQHIEECCSKIHQYVNKEQSVNNVVYSFCDVELIVADSPVKRYFQWQFNTIVKRKYDDHDIPSFAPRMILLDNALFEKLTIL